MHCTISSGEAVYFPVYPVGVFYLPHFSTGRMPIAMLSLLQGSLPLSKFGFKSHKIYPKWNDLENVLDWFQRASCSDEMIAFPCRSLPKLRYHIYTELVYHCVHLCTTVLDVCTNYTLPMFYSSATECKILLTRQLAASIFDKIRKSHISPGS